MTDLVRKILEAVTSSAAAGERSARSRGVPGYPVPPEMRPEDPVEEATEPKGIAHLEDLEPAEFLRWLEKYRDLPLKGGLEVSEKVDGSAKLTFGVEDGKLWTQTKNGPRRDSAEGYPAKPMFDAVRHAHLALASRERGLVKWWDVETNDVVFGAEVLYTGVPNSIEYGPNVIMIYGVLGPGGMLQPAEAKKIVDDLVSTAGKTLHDGKETWRLEYKRIVRPDELKFEFHEEFSSLSQIYADLRKAHVRGETDRLRARFQAIQLSLKEKLVDQLRGQQPAYGPEGGDVEGLVFRDLESGQLTKLVDRNFFTALNKFMWFYRELLGRGVKSGEKWVPGIGARLRSYLSDEVMGTSSPKSPAFVSNLKKKYGTPKTPEEADRLLARYVEDNRLMRGEFVSKLRAVVEKTRREFEVVRSDWEARREDPTFVSKDGRERKMPDVVKRRTEDAFDDMTSTLDGVERAADEIEGIPDQLTKRVAMLKVVLGQSGLEKLGGGAKLETKKIGETVGPKKISAEKAAEMAQVVQDNSERLAKRKIDVSGAKALGAGGNGVAFDLGQTVLKITKDTKEANSSAVIRGKDFPNIVKVFDVFRFPDTEYFGIWQEKLQPCPGQDKNEFTEFVTDVEVESGMFSKIWALGDWKEIVDHAMEGAREDSESTAESVGRVRKEIMVLQRKYQMDKIVAQLKAAKIKFRDFHGGNIMLRGSEHVLIDLGYSQSPRRKVANLEGIVGLVTNLVEGPPPIPASQRATPRSQGKVVGITDVQARPFIKKNAEKLAKKGINVNSLRPIGTGTRGIAYDVGGDRVMKVTNDAQEAIAANKLKGLNLKRVVKIFDVFRFPDSDPRLKEIYGVVQEKLEPLDGSDNVGGGKVLAVSGEAAELNDILMELQLPQTIAKSYDWDVVAKTIRDHVSTEVRRKYPQFATDDIDRKYAEKYAEKMNGLWNTVTKKFHIDDMVRELSAKGIRFHDYHAGNIMKRTNGDYVVIDIGYSKVAGGKEPPVLEKIVEGIISELSVSGPVDFNPVNHVEDGEVDKAGKIAESDDDKFRKLANDYVRVHNLAAKEYKAAFKKIGAKMWNADAAHAIKPTSVDFIVKMMRDNYAGKPDVIRTVYSPDQCVPFPLTVMDSYPEARKHRPQLESELRQIQKKYQNEWQRILDREFPAGVNEGNGSKADTVGVTIGRFQPFHKGHAEMIRKLATRYTKVVVIVAGNRPDAKNPFSYELRREMMEASLPDVEPKLEVYKAEVDGKPSGFLPGILNRIVVDKNSSVETDTAITILVGPDRFEDVKRMISSAKQAEPGQFDPGMAVVEKMPDVKDDDSAGRISGTQARAALAANKKDVVAKLMDPHVVSDPGTFSDLYQKMRKELSRFIRIQELREDAPKGGPGLEAVGGVIGMSEILSQNAEVIKRARSLDVTQAKVLGNGQMGVAYELLNGKVLKLTTDHEEAKTAAYLKGKSEDHITKFFDVFGLKVTKDSGHPVYCVLEEKLTPLSEQEQTEFNEFARLYLRKDEIVRFTATRPFKEIWEKIREMVIDDISGEMGVPKDSLVGDGQTNTPGATKVAARAQKKIVDKLTALRAVVKKYQIDQMVDELRALNVQFADFHGGNVMKRGQNYVINDLGKSKSPGVEPPQIEMIVREVVDSLVEHPGGGVGGGLGGAHVGVKAGSSGWSSARNMTDRDDPDDMPWQEMIPDPNLKMRP